MRSIDPELRFFKMKYYIIAGEASGDLHASNLMKEIKLVDSAAEFRCWGGDMMKAQGAELVKHYRELAFMGFTEVLLNIRTILKKRRHHLMEEYNRLKIAYNYDRSFLFQRIDIEQISVYFSVLGTTTLLLLASYDHKDGFQTPSLDQIKKNMDSLVSFLVK